jgi:hypothetical protein
MRPPAEKRSLTEKAQTGRKPNQLAATVKRGELCDSLSNTHISPLPAQAGTLVSI